jgi:hypothetical protein
MMAEAVKLESNDQRCRSGSGSISRNSFEMFDGAAQ